MGENRNHLLLVVLDGLGDRPVKALGGRTPLEAAKTPNLDWLIKKGKGGLIEPIFEGPFPTSKDAHLSLFGYSLSKWNMGRGVFEAAGLGLKLKKDDLAFRGNWATVDKEMKIVDRRAGRIKETKALIQALKKIHSVSGVHFIIKPGIEHRFVLIMRGKRLSDQIASNDQHQEGVRVPSIVSLDNEADSQRTAAILNHFLEESRRILSKLPFNKEREEKGLPSANYLLLRGVGRLREIPSFEEKWGLVASCLTGGGLYQGISRLLGMKVIKVEGTTGRVDTNLEGKFQKASAIMKKTPFLFLHVKGTDTLSHDGNCQGKKEFIEKIDQALKPLLNLSKTTIIVTADHATPCEQKQHSTDLIPFLIWSKKIREDSLERFTEKECSKGSLGLIRQDQFLATILGNWL